jgi:hypothetical protein
MSPRLAKNLIRLELYLQSGADEVKTAVEELTAIFAEVYQNTTVQVEDSALPTKQLKAELDRLRGKYDRKAVCEAIPLVGLGLYALEQLQLHGIEAKLVVLLQPEQCESPVQLN